MLTRDHTVLSATHMFIHKWNKPYLPLLPSRRASPHFGRYSFSVSLSVEGCNQPEWLVTDTNRGGLPAGRRSSIPVLTGPGVNFVNRDQCATTKPSRHSPDKCYAHWPVRAGGPDWVPWYLFNTHTRHVPEPSAGV